MAVYPLPRTYSESMMETSLTQPAAFPRTYDEPTMETSPTPPNTCRMPIVGQLWLLLRISTHGSHAEKLLPAKLEEWIIILNMNS